MIKYLLGLIEYDELFTIFDEFMEVHSIVKLYKTRSTRNKIRIYKDRKFITNQLYLTKDELSELCNYYDYELISHNDYLSLMNKLILEVELPSFIELPSKSCSRNISRNDLPLCYICHSNKRSLRTILS